jgi:hypothetical protein
MAELLVDAIVAQAYYSLLLRFEPLTEKYANALIDQVLRERKGYCPGIVAVLGSAPRVRGTRCRDGLGHAPLRFSPACAGNACSCYAPHRVTKVQPRVCGERTT